MPDISSINSGIVNSINLAAILRVLGWVVTAVLVIGVVVGGYWFWRQRKVFSKKITVFEIVGNTYSPVYRDVAKVEKIGSGGFEILYLRKLKTWKVAYGGRIGKDTYYFFIAPDGYWYNGMISADMNAIDKNKGLMPIVTTNPSMRAQYTSLEKQIDSLHSQKKSFMEKYGFWVLSIGFIVVIGVFAWLIFQQMAPLMGQFTTLTDKMSTLVDQINKLLANTQMNNGGNLVPVGK